ncbi:hypothetical protein PQX77_004215 [Marasmius sp. AFHP31]|nr:hypothetical protein PQX77_004215 [Marasmius sp. AFHP31]
MSLRNFGTDPLGSESTMYSILSFTVLCCTLLGQRAVLAAPAGGFVLARQQDESSINTLSRGHLRTLGLAIPPEQTNTVSVLSNVALPTTFTVARVESDTTVYQVQTVTLYPFQSSSTTTSPTPAPTNSPSSTNLGAASQSSSGDREREMLFWVAAAACLAVIIPILAIFVILCLRKRAYIRRTEDTARWRDTSTLKVEERKEDGFSFGVADGKIWMAKSDKAEEKRNRRLLRSLDRF